MESTANVSSPQPRFTAEQRVPPPVSVMPTSGNLSYDFQRFLLEIDQMSYHPAAYALRPWRRQTATVLTSSQGRKRSLQTFTNPGVKTGDHVIKTATLDLRSRRQRLGTPVCVYLVSKYCDVPSLKKKKGLPGFVCKW